MKTFDKLTEAQKEIAVHHEVKRLLNGICEGAIRFNDEVNGDDLQVRIDAAFEKAESIQTPRFAASYVMDTCREEIEGMARAQAEKALYPELGEYVSRAGVFS